MAINWAYWAIQAAIAITVVTIGILIMPKPKGPKPTEVDELQEPTVSAGKPVPVPFGTVWIESPNILWFGDKASDTYKVKV